MSRKSSTDSSLNPDEGVNTDGISLDKFVSSFTSEDNESFEQIQKNDINIIHPPNRQSLRSPRDCPEESPNTGRSPPVGGRRQSGSG